MVQVLNLNHAQCAGSARAHTYPLHPDSSKGPFRSAQALTLIEYLVLSACTLWLGKP
jgi:hypothetical protein